MEFIRKYHTEGYVNVIHLKKKSHSHIMTLSYNRNLKSVTIYCNHEFAIKITNHFLFKNQLKIHDPSFT